MQILVQRLRSFDELVDFMGQLFPMPMTSERSDLGSRTEFRCIDIDFVIHDRHDFLDDSGIFFEHYEYYVDLVKLRGGSLHHGYDSMASAVAGYLAGRISGFFRCETELVESMQVSLGIYRNGILLPANDR